MDTALQNVLTDSPAPGLGQVIASSGRSKARVACYHCGENCPDDTFAQGEKVFCCQGCLVVHDLLAESGLGQFYDLSKHPGVRVRKPTQRERLAFLDEPSVSERLLDFTDGKVSKVTFHIPAIHCVACVWLLENLFRLHPGVGASRVNFARREAAISFSPDKIALSELVALLCSLGYEPSLTLGELEKRKLDPGRKRQWLQLGIAAFGFGNVMLVSLPQYLGLDSFSGPLFRAVFGYLSLALAAPVLIYSAADYWRSAWSSLRQRTLTLDVPIALGLAALYAQSTYEIVAGRGEGYLDSLTGLIFFLLCGRVFQKLTNERLSFDRDYKCFFPLAVTRKRSSADSLSSQGRAGSPLPAAKALTRALPLAPHPGALETARPTHPAQGRAGSPPGPSKPWRRGMPAGGGDESVAISELRVGDHIVVRNGELIPADARLISGEGLIDYSFVTGEAEPVAKRPGAYIYAGGRHIGSAIELETVKPVSQSYLTSLWDHEAFRKERREDLSSLTNRYSRRFTLIVLAVALGAAAYWAVLGQAGTALKAFISVLIVACPCALALAAPFTLGTIQRALARRQVFFKNPLVLERMAQIDMIVFDKTGTLTAGRVGALAFHPMTGCAAGPLSAEEQRRVASLARQSTHPLATRISESLVSADSAAPVSDFLEVPGAGLAGLVEGHALAVGSRAWLEGRGVGVPDFMRPEGSAVLVAMDGTCRGWFALGHDLRPDTAHLLGELGQRFELALLSGDNETERERFRSLLGPNARLCFNQSPLDKLGFIQRLQEAGKRVMMVGDGLNDAGALRQSDVGVAVVENVGGFSPASDVILVAGEVPRLHLVISLANSATRIVRLNFGVSALYNLAGISIAAAGLLSPVVCAVLMPLSSISVVLLACGAASHAAARLGLSK